MLFCGLSHEQAHAWILEGLYTALLILGKDVRVIIIISILVDPCADLQRAYSHLF